ncbi:MAG: ABC transporter ATP-binding protein [Bacteroidales bacterium]|nr:ABC transporter ATP-binding protein [Bacteroidales bacterium]
MIQLQDIHFAYRKDRVIFNELNLSLTNGHIYGLFGKNGAGKTTLLKIMAGLRFAQEGTVTTLGENAALRKVSMLKDIYFLSEEMYAPALTIKKYVQCYAPFYENFNHDQFDEYLHLFEITDQSQKLTALSLGQKKKVLISFALATNTKILLMDEPTNGLDIPSKTSFRKIMSMAASDDRLIFISTHQVRDLHSLIDAVVILDNGSILLNATTDEITEKLCFKVTDANGTDEPILYCEDNLQGSTVVTENVHHIETKLDIELLFNAVMINKQRINELFNHKF